MGTSAVALTLLAASITQATGGRTTGGRIQKQEMDYQQEAFQQWWETAFVTKLDDLPTEGVVPKHRVPYSGHDYPDRGGGTIKALRKYDRAFHGGQGVAVTYERKDILAHRRGLFGRSASDDRPRRGLFGRRLDDSASTGLFSRGGRGFFGGGFFGRIPAWHGHCNGWAAAAIRHAEPQNNVVRRGVVFTPADIKGLLAEIYIYNDTEFLGGIDYIMNPATIHLVLSNWLGRGEHPIGMETTPGKEAWNYPIFSYATALQELSDGRHVDVQTTVRYATSTPSEHDQSPRNSKDMEFRYRLELDAKGQITGGVYMRGSNRIDMLWTPLNPVQGGKKGNELGNPYVNVREVLAMWRESVPSEVRKQWLNIDPAAEDRVLESSEESSDKLKPTEQGAPSSQPETNETPSPQLETNEAPSPQLETNASSLTNAISG